MSAQEKLKFEAFQILLDSKNVITEIYTPDEINYTIKIRRIRQYES